MPQADKSDFASSPSGRSDLEGKSFQFDNPEDRLNVLRKAFDYRGDVTLELEDDSSVEGFIHNIDLGGNRVSLFAKLSKRESENQDVALDQVKALHFSGEDTAFGKSWDDWVAKSNAQREKEAEKLRRQAIERGEL